MLLMLLRMVSMGLVGLMDVVFFSLFFPEVCRIGDDAPENQNNWYFFSHKDKKYPTGNRANRATAAGFWKATGRDKPIHTQHVIGMRKTLVFYKGRAPHGQKTDWIMHEFRLDEGPGAFPNFVSPQSHSLSIFFASPKNKMEPSLAHLFCPHVTNPARHRERSEAKSHHSLPLPEFGRPPTKFRDAAADQLHFCTICVALSPKRTLDACTLIILSVLPFYF